MNGVMNNTQLAEKRYKNNIKKDKKETGLNNRKLKKWYKKMRKNEENYQN